MTIEATTMQPNDMLRTELLTIAAANGGNLAPEAIVEAARPATSPLHDYFEWDENQAAERYRVLQAAFLIRRVKLDIVKVARTTQVIEIAPVRAFASDTRRRGHAPSYRKVEAMLADPESRAALVEAALKELIALRRKHERLTELAEVWTAIDALGEHSPVA